MDGDQRFVRSDFAIDEPRHDLVALRVEPPIRTGLRHAVRELTATQVMVRRHCDFLWPGDFCVGRILPIDMEIPGEDSVVFKYILQLRSARGHYDVRRA